MNLSLFDWHCDTANEMLRQDQELTRNHLAVSLEHASVFSNYIQVMALWTEYGLSDEEGWNRYHAMLKNLKADPAFEQRKARLCTSAPCLKTPLPKLLLGVEDARILNGQIERLDRLHADGVRVLTLLWSGETCIGGSHNTQSGLTEFGKQVVRRAIELGMFPDISHASVESAADVFAIAQEYRFPVIASHSNAYDVCPVSRNLRNDQVTSIIKSDGIIGLNLYQGFLKKDSPAHAEDVLPHVEHFLSLGAKDALCLGGDMDGCELPDDIPTLKELPLLADLMLRHNYSEELVKAIFFENANRFANQYLISF